MQVTQRAVVRNGYAHCQRGQEQVLHSCPGDFEQAMRRYDEAGLQDDWQQVVAHVRAEHSRKTGFMPGFEKITGGTEPDHAPLFLEGAKVRWVPPLSQES